MPITMRGMKLDGHTPTVKVEGPGKAALACNACGATAERTLAKGERVTFPSECPACGSSDVALRLDGASVRME